MKKNIEEALEKGDRAEGIRLLEIYLQQHPGDEAGLLQCGELLYADGKMPQALNKFNAVIRLNPENRKAKNYVAMINTILGYYCKDMFNP